MNIKITVLMSVYNTREEYLREAIESILDQTMRDFEFIIVNDGSAEDTVRILDEYKDERIIRINNDRNLGLTASLNRGLVQARGKYIARMDADDVSLPDRLKLQYQYMERHPQVAVLGSWARLGGKVLKYQGHVSSKWRKVRMLIENVGIAHPTAFLRTDFLRQHELMYNEAVRKSQDYDLWTRCLEYGKIGVCPHVLLKYRVHEEQISTVNSVEQIQAKRQIRTRLLDALAMRYTQEELEQFLTLEKVTLEPEMLSDFLDRIMAANKKKMYYDRYILKKELTFVWLKTVLGIYDSDDPGKYRKTHWFRRVLSPAFWVYLAGNILIRNI